MVTMEKAMMVRVVRMANRMQILSREQENPYASRSHMLLGRFALKKGTTNKLLDNLTSENQ